MHSTRFLPAIQNVDALPGRAAAAVALLLMTLLPTTSWAAEPQPETREVHCVAELRPDQEIDPKAPQEEPEVTCFDSFGDAIFAATNGLIWLGRDAGPDTLTDEDIERASLRGVTLVGILYQHSRFRGSTFTRYANNSVGCRTGYSYSNSSMPSGWNDKVSSARGFGGCGRDYLYEHRFFGGAAQRCFGQNFCNHSRCSCYRLKAMNDKTSSVRWFRSGAHY